MSITRVFVLLLVFVISIASVDGAPQVTSPQQARKPFTLADEIGLTLFGTQGGGPGKILFSPDKKYVAVWSERGRLDVNRVEDSLRFYRCEDLAEFLKRAESTKAPLPVFEASRSEIYGDSIDAEHSRWLPDSSGLAFTGNRLAGPTQLFLADLRTKTVHPLTPIGEAVNSFDVRDREHFAYTAYAHGERGAEHREGRAEPPVAIVGTGHSLTDLLLPDDELFGKDALFGTRAPRHLWVVVNGKRVEVKDEKRPVDPDEFALSPDGSSLVAILPVREVPSSWVKLYPPPAPLSAYRIRQGGPAHQFVRIDLKTGSIQSLTNAPMDGDAGWGRGYWHPSWSNDGSAVLLPSTLLQSADTPSAPCVAVLDITAGTRKCVVVLKGPTDARGYHNLFATEAFFAGGNKDRVIVTTIGGGDLSYHTVEYRRISSGDWRPIVQSGDVPSDQGEDLKIVVDEGLNRRPRLVVRQGQTSRVIWDPNPQLDKIELGAARVYTWKDNEGRSWKGGLYEPVGYKRGERYPLLIQTHGFRENEFRPSGLYPTASAARVFAAAGMFVLQVADKCPLYLPEEAPCAVSGYDSAAKKLVSEGLVDPENIGIIGFSRTCFYVLKALTTSSLHFKAASITDGFEGNYSQYISQIDLSNNDGTRQLDAMMGGPPFGEHLQQWFKRSPGFNLDKVSAPLLVVAGGRASLLDMWETYAVLHHFGKPSDLIILNNYEHVMTNPGSRLVSQGGSVDWFRFWLQGYEDPDPAKAEQYGRWKKLRQPCCD